MHFSRKLNFDLRKRIWESPDEEEEHSICFISFYTETLLFIPQMMQMINKPKSRASPFLINGQIQPSKKEYFVIYIISLCCTTTIRMLVTDWLVISHVTQITLSDWLITWSLCDGCTTSYNDSEDEASDFIHFSTEEVDSAWPVLSAALLFIYFSNPRQNTVLSAPLAYFVQMLLNETFFSPRNHRWTN